MITYNITEQLMFPIVVHKHVVIAPSFLRVYPLSGKNDTGIPLPYGTQNGQNSLEFWLF